MNFLTAVELREDTDVLVRQEQRAYFEEIQC